MTFGKPRQRRTRTPTAAELRRLIQTRAGKHSWRATVGNGQNVGGADESFASKTNAQRAADNAGTATGP